MEKTIFQQYGGRLIGEGSYGCVFDPPIRCSRKIGSMKYNTTKQEKVGKVGIRSEVDDELNVVLYFKDVPNANKYMILGDLNSKCKIETLDKQEEPEISKCEIIHTHSMNDLYQFTMAHGGIDLASYSSLNKLNPMTFSFVDFSVSLIEVGAFIALNGFVHGDIHSGNILFDATKSIRLVDFGRSYIVSLLTPSVIDSLAVKYNEKHDTSSPEISLQDGVNNGVSVNEVINHISLYKNGLILGERLLGMNQKREVMKIKEFWNASKSVKKGDWLTFYKLYWPQVDSWSIGVILIKILKIFKLSKAFYESPLWKKKRAIMELVLRGLLRASPIERFDCVEALAALDPMNHLLQTPSGKSWLAVKKQRLSSAS